LDWQKNSKAKIEKAFLFIFMSSYAEMGFWGSNKIKTQHMVQFFSLKWVDMGVKLILR
jgi:uncharacterized FlgJ-related protein